MDQGLVGQRVNCPRLVAFAQLLPMHSPPPMVSFEASTLDTESAYPDSQYGSTINVHCGEAG